MFFHVFSMIFHKYPDVNGYIIGFSWFFMLFHVFSCSIMFLHVFDMTARHAHTICVLCLPCVSCTIQSDVIIRRIISRTLRKTCIWRWRLCDMVRPKHVQDVKKHVTDQKKHVFWKKYPKICFWQIFGFEAKFSLLDVLRVDFWTFRYDITIIQ